MIAYPLFRPTSQTTHSSHTTQHENQSLVSCCAPSRASGETPFFQDEERDTISSSRTVGTLYFATMAKEDGSFSFGVDFGEPTSTLGGGFENPFGGDGSIENPFG